MRFSSRLPRPAAACAVLLLTWMSPVPAPAQEMPEEQAPDPGLEVARRFVEHFLEGELEEAEKLMDTRMREAMTPEEARRFAETIQGQAGQPGPIGEVWLRATTGVYRHFIVPVAYEQREVQLRVVLDGQEQVAGFYLVASEEEEAGQSEGGTGSGESEEAPADPAEGGSEPEEKPDPPPSPVRPGDAPSW